MKILLLLCTAFCVSCASTKYDVQDQTSTFDFARAGDKYIFHKNSGEKMPLTVTAVEKDSIRGLHKKKSVAIAKTDIKTVIKNNTSGTVILVSAGAGAVAVAAVLAKNFTDTVNSFGGADNGD